MLLQRTIEHLMAHIDEFLLEVNPKNMEAIALYAKLGFEKTAVLERYYSDGSDAVRMRLVLRGPIPKPESGGQ
jgi:ribosomal protein S18 acetylase RimI-like enzyme